MDAFIRRNMGDLELSRDVAAIFIDHRKEYIEAIRNAITAHDAVALRESAHKLKGAAANLALPLLLETAGMIESRADRIDTDKVTKLLSELEQRFEQAVEAIQEQLISPSEKADQ